MGAPVEGKSFVSKWLQSDDALTDGLVFVEFSAADIAPLKDLFVRLGFSEIAQHRSRNIGLWRQGGIDIVLNADPSTHAADFATKHGPCISAIGFRVKDADEAYRRCVEAGAIPYSGADGEVAFPGRTLVGIGGSILYLIDEAAEQAIKKVDFGLVDQQETQTIEGAGFVEMDHLTHNVKAGGLEQWVNFYHKAFGFREVFYLDTKGTATGFRTKAVKSPCNRICIAINEPTDPKSQIQEFIDLYKGEGVQHIAFRSDDLNASMEAMAQAEIPTQPIPASYYADIDQRLPSHGQDVSRLQKNQILIDGEREGEGDDWRMLLQVFSKNMMGPIFFEFIERRSNDGFGEGNAQALFEAIERDQMERGVVSAQ